MAHKTPLLNETSLAFVDFFAGCGGMSFGFHQLSGKNGPFCWRGAFDNDSHANSTYAANFGVKPALIDLGHEEALREVKKEMKKNGKFTLPSFGTFTVRKTKARKGLNPRTGEAIKVKAGKTVRFKASPTLKKSV